MLGGAILKLGSTTFLFWFLLPFILPKLVAKDEDKSSLEPCKPIFLENLWSWWWQQQENRRKWIRTKANTTAKTLVLVIFIVNWESFSRLCRKHGKMKEKVVMILKSFGYLDEIYMKRKKKDGAWLLHVVNHNLCCY